MYLAVSINPPASVNLRYIFALTTDKGKRTRTFPGSFVDCVYYKEFLLDNLHNASRIRGPPAQKHVCSSCSSVPHARACSKLTCTYTLHALQHHWFIVIKAIRPLSPASNYLHNAILPYYGFLEQNLSAVGLFCGPAQGKQRHVCKPCLLG
jgi:hypothetical protein